MITSDVVVNICNSAMIKLGAEPINDLNDDTKEARLCRLQFDRIRDTVLRSAPWSFAMKRVVLNPTTDTLAFGDGNIFLLPDDCVKFVRMYEEYGSYTIEGENLICAQEVVQGWYVSNNVTPDKYDPSFSEALAYAIAADLCYTLTQSDTMRQGLLSGMQVFTQEARSYNSQEKTPEDFKFDIYDNVRRGGRAIYDEPDFV